jgi:hypothetical protein
MKPGKRFGLSAIEKIDIWRFRQREAAFRHGITSSREFPVASEAPKA